MQQWLANKYKIIVTLFLVIVTIVFISACSGFHLRGWSKEMPPMLQKVYIEDNVYDGFSLALSQQLNSTNATVVSNKDKATSIIKIINSNIDNKLLNVLGSLGASQYSQTYSITYEVLDTSDNVILDPHYISATETYAGNSSLQLSLDNVINETTEQLQEQVASALVNQLFILKPSGNTIIPHDFN
ncbi:hypothetical protein OAO18_09140 [Francisellaceae bacterium]|nr:hypothetical protein [Francisellaceae bacterium]